MLHQSLNRGLIIEIIKFLSQFIIHPSSLRVFCDNCKIEFYSADELIRHIKHEHQRNEARQPVVSKCRMKQLFTLVLSQIIKYGFKK
eukprot:jgi/Bigna1/146989/aug1.126_g21697